MYFNILYKFIFCQDARLRGQQIVDVESGGGWKRLANMGEKRAGHGCEVATVGTKVGIMVAGGSNSGDSVEFLDWMKRSDGWVKMDRLGRQRRFGLGLAHVGGKLTAVSWRLDNCS